MGGPLLHLGDQRGLLGRGRCPKRPADGRGSGVERGRNWRRGFEENLCPDVLRAHTGPTGCELLFTSSPRTSKLETCIAWGQLHITARPTATRGRGTGQQFWGAQEAGRLSREGAQDPTGTPEHGAEAGGSLRVHSIAVLHNLQANTLPHTRLHRYYVTAGHRMIWRVTSPGRREGGGQRWRMSRQQVPLCAVTQPV